MRRAGIPWGVDLIAGARRRFGGVVRSVIRTAASPDFIGIWILVALIGLFGVVVGDTFLTYANLRSITGNQAVPGLIALALILPLTAGEFDISVASVLTLSAIVVTGLFNVGAPIPVACLAGLASGLLIGLLNGVFVAVVGINSLIVTLASGSIALGVAEWWTNGRIFYANIPEGFTWLGQADAFGLPLPVFYLAITAVAMWWLLGYTPMGRYLYALGDNKLAAQLAGLPTKRLTVGAFMGSGLLSAVAGIVEAAKLGAGSPTVGPSFLLPAFAAVFLGATMIHPGKYNAVGTMLGVFLVAVGLSGLELIGVPFYMEPIFTGTVLVVAVALTKVSWTRLRSRRRTKVAELEEHQVGAQI